MTALRAAAMAGVVAATAACSVRIAELGAAATVPVVEAREPLGWCSGRVCRWWFLGVPFGLPTIDGAMNAAMRPIGARLLRDVVVTSDHSVYLLFGQNCYTVSGEAFR